MQHHKTVVKLRPAIPADIPILEYWDTQPHVIAAGGADDDWDWVNQIPYNPDWREQLIAELDGKPIGFIQIIDPALEESHYWGDCEENLRAIDIWIGEKTYLGQGYGTQMMRQAIDICFAVPAVKAILIDPLETNVRAHRFYERFGFRFIERRTFEDDKCFVYRLERP